MANPANFNKGLRPCINEMLEAFYQCQESLPRTSQLYKMIDSKAFKYGTTNRSLNEKEIKVFEFARSGLTIQERPQQELFHEGLLHLLRTVVIEKADEEEKDAFFGRLSAVPEMQIEERDAQKRPSAKITPEQQWCLEVIQQNRGDIQAYFNLAATLEREETLPLPDGIRWGTVDIFLEVLKYHLEDADAWAKLCESLSPDARAVHIHGKGNLDYLDICFETLKRSPRSPSALFGVAQSMMRGPRPLASITLPDSSDMTRKEILIEVIKGNRRHSEAYCELGIYLDPKEPIVISKGPTLFQKDLFWLAIHYNHKNAKAYYHLAHCLKPNEYIYLPSGTKAVYRKLLILAVEANPKYSDGLAVLANDLSERETVSINNSLFTKQKLLIEAIHWDSDPRLYFNSLAQLMIPGERVTFLDGKKMERAQLLSEGAKSIG